MDSLNTLNNSADIVQIWHKNKNNIWASVPLRQKCNCDIDARSFTQSINTYKDTE